VETFQIVPATTATENRMHPATRWPRAIALSFAIAAALSAAACNKGADAPSAAGKMAEATMVASDSAAPPTSPEAQQALASRSEGGSAGEVAGLANRNGSQLAYALDVRVRLPAQRIADNLTKVREACANQTFGPCDVLGEQLEASSEYPSGTLQLRAAPAAIGSLVKAAAEGGTLAQRSSTAEDLAFAVRDNGMRRKRLELQHAKLMEIAQRRDIKVDELMALTERLAMLEAELQGAEQEAAVQQSRIATNQLTLHFDAENVAVASETSTRISEALRGLTGTWDQIIAWMISAFLGALLPFALVFGTAAWLLYRLLRRRRPAAPTP
jgi:hypothetical protein